MKPNEFKETNWNRLIDEIEKGQIIPIIGPELLSVDVDGKSVYLYDWLAAELASRLEIDIQGKEDMDISDIIYQYRSRGGFNTDPTQPYYDLYDILRHATFNIPEALKLLAGIDKLTLFLSTTFDNYMEKALIEYRGKQPSVKSLSFAKSGIIEDIPAQYNGSIVYHIFGKVNNLPTYVVTEEDLLEFCQKWFDPERRPSRLNAILKDKDKYFMLLGCSFENWLTRFFLYGMKSETLFDPKARKGVIADNKSAEDEHLAFFLSRCNSNLYSSGNAIEFIKELSKRWNEREKTEIIESNEQHTEQFIEGSVFLSYAGEDKDLARQIHDALEKAGIDVWFDEKNLESGDKYKEKIVQNIRKSSFFIPLITHNTITPERRFFRFEWSEAIADMSYRPGEIPFIIPLIKGEVSESEPLIPKEFKQLHWTRIDDTNSIDDFTAKCKQSVRTYHRIKK
jgi:hypothetical protein